MTVRFAKVKAGHDKDHVYPVIGEDENKVFLVNGTTKKMQNPKKKSRQHIQIIKNLPKNITGHFLDEADWSDETVKCALNEYAASINK